MLGRKSDEHVRSMNFYGAGRTLGPQSLMVLFNRMPCLDARHLSKLHQAAISRGRDELPRWEGAMKC